MQAASLPNISDVVADASTFAVTCAAHVSRVELAALAGPGGVAAATRLAAFFQALADGCTAAATAANATP